mmetsp:Transcript_15640/g.23687  ORF Transcript_15640/g.23687 Transcript_15640/m.23687 type:complete len:376 (+) Transcript_15640:118-1245(+)|eukprot:CAMPEP_0178917700 /NCGR_PEP_ID=MMETSP0786-20121207/13397_1 /TAXON_ID=186022 /ORGANISM="Thalassionema frauenfeldii, Strain CCMP 1798" /LENGTH=375 /DNA_ID=CAMNT_0020591289 /DNA_START=99 /DNA_END=1226 /DNA_ORIENTATION=+
MGIFLAFSLLVIFFLDVTAAEKDGALHTVKEMMDWVRSNGGFISEKVDIRRMDPNDKLSPFGVFATKDIDEKENILHIPKSLYVSPLGSLGENETLYYDGVCQSAHTLMKETKLGDESKYAPYLRYLKIQKQGALPATYSKAGKDILRQVFPPGHDGVDWIDKHFRESGCILKDDTFAEHAVALVIQRGFDGTLIPIWDMVNHDNGRINTDHNPIHSDQGISVHASQPIPAGEQLYNTYDDCVDCGAVSAYWGTPEILRDFGFVEDYPQRWVYMYQDVWFQLDHSNDEYTVIFDEGEPEEDYWGIPKGEAVQFLLGELRRLDELATLVSGTRPKEIPEHEWNTITQFHHATRVALREVIKVVANDKNYKGSHDEF